MSLSHINVRKNQQNNLYKLEKLTLLSRKSLEKRHYEKNVLSQINDITH